MATPSGTVQVSVDGQSVGTITLDGSGAGSISGPGPSNPGSHSASGVYSGDSNFNGCQAATTFNTSAPSGKANSTMTISATVNADGTVTISVTVAPA